MCTRRSAFYLCGPTASGKTALGMHLAKSVPGIVFINADTMQLYRGLEPLAAHPPAEDMARVEHRMFSVLDPREPFGRAQWLEMAMQETQRVLSQGRIPVLIGGSRSLAAELARAAWRIRLPVDQDVAPTFGDSGQNQGLRPLPFDVRLLAVLRPVEDLEERIRARLLSNRQAAVRCVADMLQALEGDLDHAALWTFGFRELRAYLEGRMSLDESEDAIVLRTMAYAAEQRALFARLSRGVKLDYPGSVLELRDVQAADVEQAASFMRSWSAADQQPASAGTACLR